MNPLSSPPATWAERYETLRQYVMEDRHVLQTEPLSLLLWLSHGMAAWMRKWIQLADASQPPAAPAPLRCPTTSAWQQQLTQLLAQITAHHLQPNPCP